MSKGKAKMAPIDPSLLGFGQVPNLVQNGVGGSDSWSSTEDVGSLEALKGRTIDAYTQMMTNYRNVVNDTYTPSAVSGLYAYNPRTRTWRTYLASVVKRTRMNAATKRPATGPLNRMHPTLDEAVGAGVGHRVDFGCGEMNALNNMLWDANPAGDRGLKIDGMMVTHGTPDKEDKGAGGGKMMMAPCMSTGGLMGCREVLTKLGVRFDGGV